MNSKALDNLTEEVTNLRIAMAGLKTDLANIKKLVYIGVGTNSVAAIVVAVIMHVWK